LACSVSSELESLELLEVVVLVLLVSAATGLRWAVVGCIAFLKDEVVAGLRCWGFGWWRGFMSELWRLWWFPPPVCKRCCG